MEGKISAFSQLPASSIINNHDKDEALYICEIQN